jgi:hypothetical protein
MFWTKPVPLELPEDLFTQILLYRILSPNEQARLRQLTESLITGISWEGCNGLTVTLEMKVFVAAQAALLLLGREENSFGGLWSVLLYPGQFLARHEDELSNEEELLLNVGETLSDGPIVLSWWHSQWAARRLTELNVVLHEFAHRLADLGDADKGRPSFVDASLIESWNRIVSREFKQLKRDAAYGRPTLLDPYGAESLSEFFAVATETFFSRSWQMQTRHPELYDLFCRAYRQNPAARAIPPEIEALAKTAEIEYERQAVAECSAAIAEHPDYLEAYQMRADSAEVLEDYPQALADWRHVAKNAQSKGERAEAYLSMGRLYRLMENPSKAIEATTRALKIYPDLIEALVERAQAHQENNDLSSAKADLDAALTQDPHDDAALGIRAEILETLGEVQAALADLDAAIKLCPYEPEHQRQREELLKKLAKGLGE